MFRLIGIIERIVLAICVLFVLVFNPDMEENARHYAGTKRSRIEC
jgi:hypothetical protein